MRSLALPWGMQERRKRTQEFRSVLVARGICADVRDADGGAVGAKVACPRVLTLVDGEARDREADDRVEPPPAQGGVGEDAHQDPRRRLLRRARIGRHRRLGARRPLLDGTKN